MADKGSSATKVYEWGNRKFQNNQHGWRGVFNLLLSWTPKLSA